jgi:O-antigen biosynthesis protein WbqP
MRGDQYYFELPIPVKVEFDEYYLKNRSFALDFKILWMTVFNVLSSKDITH